MDPMTQMRFFKAGVSLVILLIVLAIIVPLAIFVVAPAVGHSINHAVRTMNPETRSNLKLGLIIFAAVSFALMLVPRSRRR